MQEAKEEGLTYVPTPMTKAGANIVGEQPGQVITLRTGAIKSVYSKQNNLNEQSSQDMQMTSDTHQAAAADVFKADLFGNYDANMQARERQREEWKENLK
jgi:ornithine carbamoyltransferase